MEKQYGTSNGHSKWTHPVYCNTDRISQPQAGASEPRAGGTPQMRAALGSPCLSLKKFLPAKAGVIGTRLLATRKGAMADHPSFLLMLSLNRKLSPFMVRMWA